MTAWLKNKGLILALILLIIPAFASLLRPGFFPMQDDLQAFRIHQMDKCFQDLQLPCRWVPDAGYQYGYPQFIFYPPLVYYLGELVHLMGFQFIDAVKILFILGYLLSALTMFLLLKTLFGRWPAFIGALLYTYAPYKAVEVYVRGAMSEFWSFVFFPLIFWASYQLIKTKKYKYMLFLAVSVGLLLTTHNVMSMIFLPVAFVWSLLWIYLEKGWKKSHLVGGGFLLGVGLAAFFTLPAILEKPYVHVDSMLSGYFGWQQHFVNLEQLFLLNNWGYGSSVLGPGDDLALSTGTVHWLVGLLAVILALVSWRKYPKWSYVAFIVAGSELLVLFMIHQKSSFIWERVNLLAWMQFPWRFLSVSVFLLSFLSALGIYLLNLRKWKIKLPYMGGILIVLVALLFYANFFKPLKWLDISDKDKFSNVSWEKQLTISIFDYLPIFATLPPISKAPEKPEVLEGQATFLSYQKGSNFQTGEVDVYEQSKIRLPLFYYPGMEVSVDNQKVPIWYNDCRNQEFCLGLITFELSPGKHIIKAELERTSLRLMADVISISSLLILLGGVLRYKRQ